MSFSTVGMPHDGRCRLSKSMVNYKTDSTYAGGYFTIRLSIFLTLARACDKRFSADHDTMLSLLIKGFGPWAFTFYQTVFCRIFRREVAKIFSHSYFSGY